MGAYFLKNVAKARCAGVMATKTGRVFGGVFLKICPVPCPASAGLQEIQQQCLQTHINTQF
jgi:hypothetical protein